MSGQAMSGSANYGGLGQNETLMQVQIQDLCKGGSRDFAAITQQSRGGSKNLGLKMGGRGAGPPPPP